MIEIIAFFALVALAILGLGYALTLLVYTMER